MHSFFAGCSVWNAFKEEEKKKKKTEVCGLCLQEEKGSCPPCPVAVWNPAK